MNALASAPAPARTLYVFFVIISHIENHNQCRILWVKDFKQILIFLFRDENHSSRTNRKVRGKGGGEGVRVCVIAIFDAWNQ